MAENVTVNFKGNDQLNQVVKRLDDNFVKMSGDIRRNGQAAKQMGREIKDGAQKGKISIIALNQAVDLMGRAMRAITALASPFGAALEEAVSQASGVVRMEFAFGQLGLNVGEARQEIEAFADQIQETTSQGDNVTREMAQQFATLAAGSVSSMAEVIEGITLAQDIAVLTGKKATRIVRALAMAYSGDAAALRTLLPGQAALIDQYMDIEDDGERARAVVATLQETFGGGREAIDATAQAMARVGNEWGDTLEAMGDAISEALLDSGVFDMVIEGLDGIQLWLTENKEEMVTFFSDLATTVMTTADALGWLASAMASVADNLPGSLPDSVIDVIEDFDERTGRLTPLDNDSTEQDRWNRERTERLNAVIQERIELGRAAQAQLDEMFGGDGSDMVGTSDELVAENRDRIRSTRREATVRATNQRMFDLIREFQESRLEMVREFTVAFAESEISQAQSTLDFQLELQNKEQVMLDERITAKLAFAEESIRIADMEAEAHRLAQAAIVGTLKDGFALGTQATNAFIDDEGDKAYILGLMSIAKSIAAVFDPTMGGPAGAIAHGIAAAAFFKTSRAAGRSGGGGGGGGAGGAGGGGGGGRGRLGQQQPRLSAPRGEQGRFEGFSGININIMAPQTDGFQVGRDAAEALNRFGGLNSGLRFDRRLLPEGIGG